MAVIKAQGTTIAIGDGGGPEVFTVIQQVVGISGISSGSSSSIDITNLLSTYTNEIVGLLDEGEISVSLYFDPDNAQQTQLRTDRAAGTLRNFEIVLTDSSPTTLSFSAYVKTYDINISGDDKITLDVTLRLQGAIVYS